MKGVGGGGEGVINRVLGTILADNSHPRQRAQEVHKKLTKFLAGSKADLFAFININAYNTFNSIFN